jgi:uncharacterized protein (TIGR02452 family)
MNRIEIAEETLKIQNQGYYEFDGKKVEFLEQQKKSEDESFLINPDEASQLVRDVQLSINETVTTYKLVNQSVIETILEVNRTGIEDIAVLNFASARNPGGGFLHGAMAQEEALAATSGLYNTLLRHKDYYEKNRSCNTAMYTNHAIYSPEVVFFRDAKFDLIASPIKASVLTLPAVNMGQVVLQDEDIEKAKMVMKDRMRLSLAIFAHQKKRNLILGAYGCGVFRNDPKDISLWWKELLENEGYGCFFDEIVFAVLDKSKARNNIAAFERVMSYEL